MNLKTILKFTALCLLVLAVPCLWFTACASGRASADNREQRTGNSGSNSEKVQQGNADIEVFPQLGHSRQINSVVFSFDGKQIVSCSGDSTIKLWDIATGREIKTFSGGDHSNSVNSVDISPDGKYILSASPNVMKLWNIATGLEVKTFSEFYKKSSGIGYIVVKFSPDSKKFISCYSTSGIILWDVVTGQEIKTLSEYLYEIDFVSFSPDGKYIVSGSRDKTVKLWDTDTGLVVKTFYGHTSSDGPRTNSSNDVDSINFSPDGKYILSGSVDKTMKLWDVATGKEIKTFSGHKDAVTSVIFSPDGKYVLSGSRDKTIKIWDISTGQEIRTFLGHSHETFYSLRIISFSSDGKHVLSRGSSVIIWNIDTSEEIISFSYEEGAYNHGFVTFNPNEKYFASGARNRDGSLILWDTDSGKEIKTFYGNTATSVASVAVTPDGKYFISGLEDGTIKLWEINTGQEIRTFYGHKSSISDVCFSPDGKYFASVCNDSVVRLWDIATGQEIRTFRQSSQYVLFSPDGKQLIISDDKDIRLWDITTGRVIRTISFNTSFVGSSRPSFSPDGKQILSNTIIDDKSVIRLWDITTGQEIRTFSVEDNKITRPQFSPDGNILSISGGPEGGYRILKLYDITTGKTIRTFSGHKSYISSVGFSPNGKYLVSSSHDNTVILWDLSTGREIRNISGHLSRVNSVMFSPDGKQMLSCGFDCTVRLWDVATGKEIAQFISFSGSDSQVSLASRGLTVETQTASSTIDGEWLSITPDGYYQASPRGDRFLNVRVGNTVSGIDSYRSVFYNPDVVQARLQGKPDPKSKANVTIQQAASFTPPQVTIKAPSTFTTTNTATTNLSVTVTDKNQSIKNIKIFVNGRAISKNELAAIKGSNLQAERTSLTVTGNQKTVNFDLSITLDPGRNLIEVVAFNGFSESARLSPIEVTYNAPAGQQRQLPNLWVLAIGVNNYDNVAQVGGNLRFAVTDAKRLTEALKSQEGKRYAKVNSLIIGDGEATLPTADNIKKSLAFLDSAGERDIVLLFLAGHGVSAQNGRFFFLPKDAVVTGSSGNWKVDEKRAISGEEITAVLEGQGNRLLFIDACQSGGVDNNRMIRAMMESNAFVFAASQGNELSYEDTRWGGGHGVFTYNVLNALKGAPNALSENNISVRSMSGFVSIEVPKMTENRQNPKIHCNRQNNP